MNLRNPVHTLDAAMRHAMEHGLAGVPNAGATELLSHDGQPPLRRPLPQECDVVVFSQSWQPVDVSWDGGDLAGVIEGECAVVLGPMQDACVYFGGRSAYVVAHPNRRFFLDVAAHCMAGRANCALYNGRDDDVTESFDYALQVQLARLFAEVRLTQPHDGHLVAALLRRHAATFERAVDGTLPRSAIDCCTSSHA